MRLYSVKLDNPWDITTDKHGRILVADLTEPNVLQISRDMEKVKQLLQGQVRWPSRLCLDEESHKMYVASEDMNDIDFVFVYDYNVFTGGKIFTAKITKLHMVAFL